jgi:nitrous oxide reductase accessory protein NosL
MKKLNFIASLLFAAALAIASLTGCSEEKKTEVGKPYPLQTCLVCGMKLADMGTPYVFVYQGQEIKVCDKSEKADFDKDPGKYMKKLSDAEAVPKK